MKLSNGIILIWSGTNASIPNGWSRVTSMDDTYPKGTADVTNPDTTGGTATHTHTSSAHSHSTASSHTHTISVASGVNSGEETNAGSDGTWYYHAHANFTSGAVASFSTSSPTSTYGTFSNNPPFYKVIYITPTTSVYTLAAGVIGLADAAAPVGFNICDGTASTPNLVDTYLLGATAAGDAGTTGGTTANTHALSHTHTTTHTHAAATSGSSDNNTTNSTVSVTTAVGIHTHSISLPAATPSTTDNVTLAASAETVEPAYTKLLAIQASATINIPLAIIALWKGTLAAIPLGWKLCDGTGGTVDMRGRHLKITGTVGGVAETGGANTHTHDSQNHGHTVAHSHTSSISHAGLVSGGYNGSGGNNQPIASTTHAITTDSVNLVIDNAATTADSSSNEPPYRTVAFIKLIRKDAGSFLLNLI